MWEKRFCKSRECVWGKRVCVRGENKCNGRELEGRERVCERVESLKKSVNRKL